MVVGILSVLWHKRDFSRLSPQGSPVVVEILSGLWYILAVSLLAFAEQLPEARIAYYNGPSASWRMGTADPCSRHAGQNGGALGDNP